MDEDLNSLSSSLYKYDPTNSSLHISYSEENSSLNLSKEALDSGSGSKKESSVSSDNAAEIMVTCRGNLVSTLLGFLILILLYRNVDVLPTIHEEDLIVEESKQNDPPVDVDLIAMKLAEKQALALEKKAARAAKTAVVEKPKVVEKSVLVTSTFSRDSRRLSVDSSRSGYNTDSSRDSTGRSVKDIIASTNNRGATNNPSRSNNLATSRLKHADSSSTVFSESSENSSIKQTHLRHVSTSSEEKKLLPSNAANSGKTSPWAVSLKHIQRPSNAPAHSMAQNDRVTSKEIAASAGGSVKELVRKFSGNSPRE
jgi:hypothetical protein